MEPLEAGSFFDQIVHANYIPLDREVVEEQEDALGVHGHDDPCELEHVRRGNVLDEPREPPLLGVADQGVPEDDAVLERELSQHEAERPPERVLHSPDPVVVKLIIEWP